MDEYLYNIMAYLGVVAPLFGLYYWRLLVTPLKISVVGGCLFSSLTLLSLLFAHFHIKTGLLIYINLLASVWVHSLFYRSALPFRLSKIILLVFPLIFSLCVGFQLIQNSIQPHFVLPFMAVSTMMLPMAILLYRQQPSNVALRIMNISLLMNFAFDLPFAFVTHNLFGFLQNKIYNTFFFEIAPVFNLVCLGLAIYAFGIASKQTRPNYGDNPVFQ